MLQPFPDREKILNYYNSIESKLVYINLLKKTKHLGYYLQPDSKISLTEAQRNLEDYLAKRLDLKENALVLDAGCGMGEESIHLSQRNHWRVTGVDILDWNIQLAKEKTAQIGLNSLINFQVQDYTQLNFPNNYFDGAYTIESLVHVSNYRDALKEFYRTLKPGGRLALFEYSLRERNQLGGEQNRLADLINEETGMYGLPHFLHDKLPQFLTDIGFTQIESIDITGKILPSVRLFYRWAFLPYQLIRLFRLQRKFINITAAYEVYQQLVNDPGCARYNAITATKPN